MNFNIQNTLGGLITITGQDGKPVHVAANTLQAQMQNKFTPGTEMILLLVILSTNSYKIKICYLYFS